MFTARERRLQRASRLRIKDAERAVTGKGLSAETVDEIKRQILGIAA